MLGGIIKKSTTYSGNFFLICFAPCQSISNRTSLPLDNNSNTSKELDYCRGRAPQLASRFAAKEAVMKALGTGTRGVRWKDVEIIRSPGNAPIINLHSSSLKRAKQIGVKHFALSLSHSKEYAVASVVGESSFGNRLDD